MDVGTVSVKVIPDIDHDAFRRAQAETSLIVAAARMYDALYYAGPGVVSSLPTHVIEAYATLGQAISNLEQ